jgi:hypothetical protein
VKESGLWVKLSNTSLVNLTNATEITAMYNYPSEWIVIAYFPSTAPAGLAKGLTRDEAEAIVDRIWTNMPGHVLNLTHESVVSRGVKT